MEEIDKRQLKDFREQTSGVYFKIGLNANREIIEIDENCLELTGYSVEEFKQNKDSIFQILVHYQDRYKFGPEILQRYSKGDLVELEYRIITKFGVTKKVKEISKRLLDAENKPYVQGYFYEIISPEAYQQLENTYKSYSQAINQGSIVSVTDINGVIIYANDLFCEYSGYTKNELIGNTHQILNSGYHSTLFFGNLWKTIKEGKIWRGEIRNKAKDGSFYWVDTVISPVLDEQGNIIEYLSIRNVISERKDLELRLAQITSTLPVVVFQFTRNINREMFFTYLSSNAVELLGITAEQLFSDIQIGRDLVYPADLKLVQESLAQAHLQSHVWKAVFRIVRNNQIRWVSCQASSKKVTDEISIWNGTVSDITDLKEMENEYQNVNLQLEHIFKTQKDCFWGRDFINSQIIYVSPGFEHIFGYPVEEMYRNPDLWLEQTVTEDRDRLSKYYETLKPDQTISIEYRIKARDGKVHWVETRMTGTFDSHGKLIRVDGVTANIDERKTVEEKILHNDHLLEEAQRIAKIGSWELDLENNVLYWSDELYRIFEIEKDEFNLNYEYFIKCVHPEDRDLVDKTYKDSLLTRNKYNIVHRLMFENGRIKYVREKCETIYDENGRAIRSTGTTQDITDQRKASIRLEELVKELTEKNHELNKKNIELDRIVYSATHDLRAPLLSIKGLLDLLNMSDRDSEDARQAIDFMYKAIERGDDTIKGIIEYSRNIKSVIETEPINMQMLIEECIENIRYMESAQNIVFKYDVNQPAPFFSDRKRIVSLVQNFITNAVKYQRPNETNKWVSVEFKMDETYAIIEVADNGEGVPANKLTTIFEMFVRNSNNTIGSGLGLYLCKEIAEQLNGEINVQSEVGKGSVFTAKFALNSGEYK